MVQALWKHSLAVPQKIRQDFPGDPGVKNPPANAGDAGLIPGSGRSSEERNGNLLQYSCLGNPTNRGPAGYSPRGHDLVAKQQP